MVKTKIKGQVMIDLTEKYFAAVQRRRAGDDADSSALTVLIGIAAGESPARLKARAQEFILEHEGVAIGFIEDAAVVARSDR
ncbi:MAG TPA: hypothetical protein VIR45_14050 [Kiloniellaceae bacterium]